ncbi:hypothetical protein Tco_1418965 [Tanacetum coccineum]
MKKVLEARQEGEKENGCDDFDLERAIKLSFWIQPFATRQGKASCLLKLLMIPSTNPLLNQKMTTSERVIPMKLHPPRIQTTKGNKPLLPKVARLEQEMSEVKKTDHSADVLASIRSQFLRLFNREILSAAWPESIQNQDRKESEEIYQKQKGTRRPSADQTMVGSTKREDLILPASRSLTSRDVGVLTHRCTDQIRIKHSNNLQMDIPMQDEGMIQIWRH